MRKKFISLIIAVCMLFCMSIDAFAAPTVSLGFAGINDYSYCSHDDRRGATYVLNLSVAFSTLSSKGIIDYRTGRRYLNNEVTPGSIKRASKETFFAYAGHGIIFDSLNNALHTNASEMNILTHVMQGETTSENFNLITTKTKFPHKYVVLYTCNQLTNGGSTTKANNILKMMNGTRLMFGFASVMYLDSREATRFVQNMQSMNIVDAYLDAANRYQTQRDGGDSIARIVGYNAARYDWITATSSYAPSAASNLSSFSILKTATIPHNGVII